MYQHRPQYCRAGIQDETLDHGGLAARKTWTEKDRGAKPRKSAPPVVSKSKFSGTLKVVRQVRLLGADEPEHVGDAGSADVQPTVVLVRRLRARLAPLDRLHQLPGVTFCTYCQP